ncbi:hypothetical protein WICMUC_002795 [Wickerhamomyces mucosus]|uniref:Hikeshi-like domain-containing protein n=1 Tax=Wickerhamomyces mucosus TaxID=1378264 RepID=A0A9P8TDU4_9ASCO|nr:hypothetical protein WICMUC_002795 [Wickerhamomyces mucosus]
MFGSVCSGRPVQLAEQVQNNKFTINIENGSKISHVALFLLPNAEFDQSFQALIYFQLPNQDFKLFGSISSMKPSAIFKLNNGGNNNKTSQILDDIEMDSEDPPIVNPQDNIVVGISIEPTDEAERQLQAMKEQASVLRSPQKQLASVPFNSSVPTNPNDTAILASKIVKHAYNYLTGFIDSQGKVSIKYFDTWWDKFRTRLQNDPKFLESQD